MAITLFENTFCEVATADQLLAGSATWSSASTAEKEFALREATKHLDQKAWAGSAVSATQTLSWPRKTFSYYDVSKGLAVEVVEGTVPRQLQLASSTLALHFLTYPEASNGYSTTWDSITVGPISLSNSNAASDPGPIPRVPLMVDELIRPFLNGMFASQGIVWWRAN